MADAKQILSLNRFEAGQDDKLHPEIAKRVSRREATFGASSVLFYEEPLHMVRADGVFMYDSAGNRYLDTYNNVPSVGHCHPHVVEAIARQAATLNTNTRYLYDNIHDYAERLLATFPKPLSNIVFTCTGSEANDVALRLAKLFTGGSGFIVTETAYHGNTTAVQEVSPASFKGRKLRPHVRAVPAPDTYRRPTDDLAGRFKEEIAGAIADLKQNGIKLAGFIADSIFSSDGIYADPAGFLKPAIDLVHEEGGVFIGDEVQPGFGRTGTHMWGFARHGVTPDIVTLGKPMGNGFPVAGTVTRPELLELFGEETGYFNTFGGNPVAAAAGLAVLDVLEDEKLMQNANETGAYLRDGLESLQQSYPTLGDIRGAGLFVAVEFSLPGSTDPYPAMASAVINAMKDEGVLIGAAGGDGNTLKIRPPLCFDQANADMFLESLDRVLGGLVSQD